MKIRKLHKNISKYLIGVANFKHNAIMSCRKARKIISFETME